MTKCKECNDSYHDLRLMKAIELSKLSKDDLILKLVNNMSIFINCTHKKEESE